MAQKEIKKSDLDSLSKDDLLDRIRQLEYHVKQLKNIIAKGKGSGDSTTNAKTKSKQRPFDWTKQNKRHVALKLAYLGWDYRGFVVQEDTNKTIEHVLFDALITAKLIESRETSNYHRCGRTDKGVSAFCQVISIDLRSNHSCGLGVTPKAPSEFESEKPEKPEIDYAGILNRILPPEVRVLAWTPVDNNFSARFDCQQRVYKYFFPKGDLNIELMNNAAKRLIGTHDFRNLCKMDVGNGVTDFTRHIDFAEVTVGNDPSGYSLCIFTVISKAFLWHQIRCIMALVFTVGKGLEKPDVIDELFDTTTNPCKPQYTMASELPLNLYDCSYEGVEWKYELESAERVLSHFQTLWAENMIKCEMLRAMICDLSASTSLTINHQADMLVADYRRHTNYRPIWSRPTCSSLEDRKEYFAKRRRVEKYTNQEEQD